jgi:hypothetical protein
MQGLMCVDFLIFVLTPADGLCCSVYITHVGANVRRYGLALPIGPNCVTINLKTETEFSLRNVVLNKNRTMDNEQKLNKRTVKWFR